MSKVPLSLLAKRNEFGGARKGVIYLGKIAIGCVAPALACVFGHAVSPIPLWFVIFWSAVGLLGAKLYYYDHHPDRPIEWDDRLDWVCDTCLHFAWVCVVHPPVAIVLFPAWLFTYPYSCE